MSVMLNVKQPSGKHAVTVPVHLLSVDQVNFAVQIQRPISRMSHLTIPGRPLNGDGNGDACAKSMHDAIFNGGVGIVVACS